MLVDLLVANPAAVFTLPVPLDRVLSLLLDVLDRVLMPSTDVLKLFVAPT